jgi:hypothetical protein
MTTVIPNSIEVPPDRILKKRAAGENGRIEFLPWDQRKDAPPHPLMDALIQRVARLNLFFEVHNRLVEDVPTRKRRHIRLLSHDGESGVEIPVREYDGYWKKSTEQISAMMQQLKEIQSWLPPWDDPIFLEIPLRSLAKDRAAKNKIKFQRYMKLIDDFGYKYHATRPVSEPVDIATQESTPGKYRFLFDNKWEPTNPQETLQYLRDLGLLVDQIGGELTMFLSYISHLDFTKRTGAPIKARPEALLLYERKEFEKLSWSKLTKECNCGKAEHGESCTTRLRQQHARVKSLLEKYKINVSPAH